jgi:hypothetical protein
LSSVASVSNQTNTLLIHALLSKIRIDDTLFRKDEVKLLEQLLVVLLDGEPIANNTIKSLNPNAYQLTKIVRYLQYFAMAHINHNSHGDFTKKSQMNSWESAGMSSFIFYCPLEIIPLYSLL